MLSIIVPSFKGHINEFERLLVGNAKYNLDNVITTIYVIISQDEIDMFQSITVNYKNVKILIFKDLMKKYFDLDIDENNFLNIVGSNVFQGFKKIVGMLESEHNSIFLTDSETQFIRNIHFYQEYKNTKTVLYSYKFSNFIQERVVSINNKILEKNTKAPFIGFSFSYQWCYRKEDVSAFFEIYKNNIIDIFINKNEPYFFPEELLYKYCFYNNIYYIFKDVTELLSYTDAEHFWFKATNNQKDKETIDMLKSLHNLFCYSVQNTWNDNINNDIIQQYTNFKILTSTPTKFEVTE